MNNKQRVLPFLLAMLALTVVPMPLLAQAHEHGVAEIGIALEGSGAQIEFTAPGSAIMGFEHEAKTAADKKKMADAFAKFKASAPAMFAFDAALGCAVKTLQIGVAEEHDHDHGTGTAAHKHEEHDHGHADVRAIVEVKCKSNPKGSTLRFAVKTVFPELSTLRVQVVGDDFQTGAELKGTRNSIRLAK